MRTAVRAEIRGRVQGVGYRAWTTGRATALGLSGWVRNRPDGSVEALFAGDPDTIDYMLSICRDGPPAARVETVERHRAEDPGDIGFSQRDTV